MEFIIFVRTTAEFIRRSKPSLRRGVVSSKEIVESGFVVTFFLSELLTHRIARVTLRRGAAASAGAEFLTERQLEDAATPSPHASARA